MDFYSLVHLINANSVITDSLRGAAIQTALHPAASQPVTSDTHCRQTCSVSQCSVAWELHNNQMDQTCSFVAAV